MYDFRAAGHFMTRPFRKSTAFGVVLGLLVPGLGHFFWREKLFGVFIFLIMILAAVLCSVALLVPMPTGAIFALLGLPLLFYAFSFVDLVRTIRRKRAAMLPSQFAARLAIGLGILYQVLAPTAPVNLGLRNVPHIYTIPDAHLSPVMRKGTVVAAYGLSYYLNIPFMKKPIFHSVPKRGDIVRFSNDRKAGLTGIVIGLPGETVAVDSGMIMVDGFPAAESLPPGLASGDWPLTPVSEYSILVATFEYGSISHAYEIGLGSLEGKVRRLF
jgi:hypothetical protein